MTEPLPDEPGNRPSSPSDHPTREFPPVEIRADDRTAASAFTASDLAEPPPDTAPVVKRRSRSWAVLGAGVAGLAIGALITAVVESHASSTASSTAPNSASSVNPLPSASLPSNPATPGKNKKNSTRGVRGVITAQTGDRWTVRSIAGPIVTVTVTSTTTFGTTKAPASRDQFAVATNVVVTGTRTGNTVVARRVVKMIKAGSTAVPSPVPTS